MVPTSTSASVSQRWSPGVSRLGREAIFHTDNGILGFGEAPLAGKEDWDLINAGKKAVTLKPGTALFHHAGSFAMVRGGHLDVAILGASQVAETGNLANWSTGEVCSSGGRGHGPGSRRDTDRGHHRSRHERRQAEAGEMLLAACCR